jgi:glutamate N-acetyltransferase / amino-acid N-acetyltransferase
MSVTAPKGFVAGAVRAGLKSSGKLDLALVVNQGPLKAAAAVFTSNRCQANPIIWSKEVIKDGQATAIILNSGGANCYTGAQGFQTTHATAEKVAEALGLSSGDVLVCSTGLIGDQLDREKLLAGTELVATTLSAENGHLAAEAIMTTDSKPKLAQVTHKDGWSIGAMAKGAGCLPRDLPPCWWSSPQMQLLTPRH